MKTFPIMHDMVIIISCVKFKIFIASRNCILWSREVCVKRFFGCRVKNMAAEKKRNGLWSIGQNLLYFKTQNSSEIFMNVFIFFKKDCIF